MKHRAHIGYDGEAVVIDRVRGKTMPNLPTRFVFQGTEMGSDKMRGVAVKLCALPKNTPLDDALWAMWQYGYEVIDRRFPKLS